MRRISRRLEQLEAKSARAARNVSFADVYQAALQKLPPRERDLAEEIMNYKASPEAVTHRAAWSQLQVVITEATRELGFPVLLTGLDLLA